MLDNYEADKAATRDKQGDIGGREVDEEAGVCRQKRLWPRSKTTSHNDQEPVLDIFSSSRTSLVLLGDQDHLQRTNHLVENLDILFLSMHFMIDLNRCLID